MTAVVETAPETTAVSPREFPKGLLANLAGKVLPILRTTVAPKEGDTTVHYWYTFRQPGTDKGNKWGVVIPRVTDELPTQVELDGVVIYLEKGRSAATTKEKQVDVVNGKIVESWAEVTIPEEKRKNIVSSDTLQILPSLVSNEHGDTGLRRVYVRVSENPANETWNVIVKVNKPAAAASPEQRKAVAQRQADKTMAELEAILASL